MALVILSIKFKFMDQIGIQLIANRINISKNSSN